MRVENSGRVCPIPWPSWLGVEAEDVSGLTHSVLDPTAPFEANKPVLIRVSTAATPCSTDHEAGCSVRLEGDVLRVTNWATWNEPVPVTQCFSREAPPGAHTMCRSPTLAAGHYAVVLAGHFTDVTIPGSQRPCY